MWKNDWRKQNQESSRLLIIGFAVLSATFLKTLLNPNSSARDNRPFTNVTPSMLFTFWEANLATRIKRKRCGHANNPEVDGASAHRHIGTTALYCEVSDAMMRNAVELV